MRGALLGRWTGALDGHAAEAWPGKGTRTVEQQRIHALAFENRRLRMEREILNKATAFLAKERACDIDSLMSRSRPGRSPACVGFWAYPGAASTTGQRVA